MNRENIKKVRDVIAALPPERFDMGDVAYHRGRGEVLPQNRTVLHNCNTAACIAGWTNALFGQPRSYRDGLNDAAQHLGLDPDEQRHLFCPVRYANGRTTAAQAVRVLDHLLETGEVDWSVAGDPT